MKLLISSLFLVVAANAFTVTQVEPEVVKVMKGGTFRVVCTADTWYEVSQSMKDDERLKSQRFLVLRGCL